MLMKCMIQFGARNSILRILNDGSVLLLVGTGQLLCVEGFPINFNLVV